MDVGYGILEWVLVLGEDSSAHGCSFLIYLGHHRAGKLSMRPKNRSSTLNEILVSARHLFLFLNDYFLGCGIWIDVINSWYHGNLFDISFSLRLIYTFLLVVTLMEECHHSGFILIFQKRLLDPRSLIIFCVSRTMNLRLFILRRRLVKMRLRWISIVHFNFII